MLKPFLILILVTVSICKLHQVVSLFRHGARYHLNALYDGNTTHNVWGQLTPVGMRQHQNIGKTLNKQYIENQKFLSPKLDKKQIEVFSTEFNRTIISALSQLYGIYPPGNGPKMPQVQRKYHLPPFTNQTDIDEQSFAFPEGHQHVMVKFDDILLLQNCPKLGQLVQKNVQLSSQEIQQMNITYASFQKKLIQLFNLPSNSSFQTFCSLFDTLIVDKYMGRPLPNGFTEDDLANLQHLHNWFNNIKYSRLVSKIINSAKFIKIMTQFDNRVKNINGYPLKWSFLSAHDTDILPAQSDLNFSSSQCIQEIFRKGKTTALNCQTDVGFASSIIFQLHSENDKDFYVMIRSQGKYMNLCQKQSTKCDYGQFKSRIQKYVVTNIDELCGVKDPFYKNQKKTRGFQSIDHNFI